MNRRVNKYIGSAGIGLIVTAIIGSCFISTLDSDLNPNSSMSIPQEATEQIYIEDEFVKPGSGHAGNRKRRAGVPIVENIFEQTEVIGHAGRKFRIIKSNG